LKKKKYYLKVITLAKKFKLLKPLLFLLTLLFSNCWAQDSLQTALKIEALKTQLISEKTQLPVVPTFSKSQNELLKKQHIAKIDEELKRIDEATILIDGPAYNQINAIFQRILTANPSIPSTTKLVIYRSNAFNAFTMGDDIIFFNVGLLHKLKNEDEIALVIGHEIAHNTLKHVENSMIDNVKFQTNDSIKQEIHQIKNSQYGKVSAYNQLLIPRLLETAETSRRHEFSSDSLGFIYIQQANFNIPHSLSMFEAMEDETHNWSEPFDLKKALHLNEFPEMITLADEYSNESSLGTFIEEDKDEKDQLYLSSHPYDRDRFVRLAKMAKMDTVLENYTRFENETTKANLRLFNKEAIHTALRNQNLTKAILFGCRYVADFPQDEFGYEVLTLCFKTLEFTKFRRSAGKYLMLQDPKQAEDLDRLCHFLNEIPPKNCALIAAKFEEKAGINSDNLSPYSSLIQLLDFTQQKKFDLFEALWLSSKKDIEKNQVNWVLKEMETYLYNTQNLKFLNPHKK
jgi:Zn-dependent protease with chaperone function